jgi:S-adenosylmethionine:tRNA ribosyltransferase-isomerase
VSEHAPDLAALGSAPAATAARPSLPTDRFDYHLPPESIAQRPAEPRDSSRLMVVHRADGRVEHAVFRDVGDWLRAGDLLVVNRTRVVPARLAARRRPGGAAEILLLRRVEAGAWEALVKPGRKLGPGSVLDLGDGIVGEVVARTAAGGRLIRFETGAGGDVDAAVLSLGRLPLPPYIHDYAGDPERYQTVYGDTLGSAAAPTAGLHFTPELLETLQTCGIGLATVTLHVGLDTFRPVKVDDLADHEIHREWCVVPPETAQAIADARARGGRVVAVGTTTVRSLESAARAAPDGAPISAWSGETDLFIVPGHRFRAVDAMITNFHLPRSTLLALVSAFVGRERMLAAYAEAIRERYRFFSFGDAMLLV